MEVCYKELVHSLPDVFGAGSDSLGHSKKLCTSDSMRMQGVSACDPEACALISATEQQLQKHSLVQVSDLVARPYRQTFVVRCVCAAA